MFAASPVAVTGANRYGRNAGTAAGATAGGGTLVPRGIEAGPGAVNDGIAFGIAVALVFAELVEATAWPFSLSAAPGRATDAGSAGVAVRPTLGAIAGNAPPLVRSLLV